MTIQVASTSMNRQWVLAERPVDRAVRESDFQLVEAPVPMPGRGEFLVRTLYVSVAPVMRQYMIDGAGIEPPLAIGDVMRGRGVGQVVASNHPDYAPGDFVQGKLGWQEYSVSDGSPYYMMYKIRQRLVPLSTAVGALGITGFTSYLGLVDLGQPKNGETVLVSGAAGGVGSNVGWIARNLGCRVVGIAGTSAKCWALTERLGYDAAINYRTDDVAAQIRELCPGGVDVFFDNVGGEILDHALGALNRYGRVVCCGRIAEYLKPPDEAYRLRNWHMVGRQRATMRGFFIYDLAEHFPRAERQIAQWIAEGRMRYLEDVLEGFEQIPRALMRLYAGQNIGKQLVRVDPAAR
ncbi:MAG TPA: NADP-dependent oxidoreductase [Steroidobacteraceae bacterium]|nr:NADP-dependent oxidoreductase [Steroidobacteraceae bacterium]